MAEGIKCVSSLLGVGLVFLVAGCYEGRHSDDLAGDSDGPGEDGGDGAPLGCGGAAFDVAPAQLRRLTHREYAASVQDLLGQDAEHLASGFPDDVVTGSFDNDARTQTISELLGDRYFAAAKELADTVMSDAVNREAVIGCALETGDPCLRSFIERFGRRAFRRPLTEQQIERLMSLAKTQSEVADQFSIVLETVLQSPWFLFKIEIGRPLPDRPDIVRLDGYEIATRLSFLLWGTTPDDDLLDAAAAGDLDSRDGIAARARAMLDDPRSWESMRDFTDQWFRLRHIPSQFRDPVSFPEFDETFITSMLDEMHWLLDEVMWGPDHGFLDLFTLQKGFVDAALAPVYGLSAPERQQAVDWSETPERGGFFTTAAFATASSHASETSPITRAVYVREVILCDPPPPPPPDVESFEPQEGESALDAFERHTQDPACAGCHAALDPIGYGLERYDSIGRLRATYANDGPVRETGDIILDGQRHEFGGGVELGAIVAESRKVEQCVTRHVWRYAMGRDEHSSETCVLDQLTDSFAASGHQFEHMLIELVSSEDFRHRRLDVSEGE